VRVRVRPNVTGQASNGALSAAVWRRWAIVASAGFGLLQGCGFHLQGEVELPEPSRRVFISTADLLTPFAVELQRSIERAGGEVTASVAEAGTVVRITRDRTGRRVLSVSARNTPQEYDVFYQIDYSVERAGKEVLESQSTELTRNMSFDDTQVLAKDREEAVLRDALARDLATLVLRRISSID
jgi:LPS-assembly lipoprotein